MNDNVMITYGSVVEAVVSVVPHGDVSELGSRQVEDVMMPRDDGIFPGPTPAIHVRLEPQLGTEGIYDIMRPIV